MNGLRKYVMVNIVYMFIDRVEPNIDYLCTEVNYTQIIRCRGPLNPRKSETKVNHSQTIRYSGQVHIDNRVQLRQILTKYAIINIANMFINRVESKIYLHFRMEKCLSPGNSCSYVSHHYKSQCNQVSVTFFLSPVLVFYII